MKCHSDTTLEQRRMAPGLAQIGLQVILAARMVLKKGFFVRSRAWHFKLPSKAARCFCL